MTKNITSFRIFIASPSDCSAEREAVRRIVTRDPSVLALRRKLNISVDAFGWEDILPDLGRPQSRINAAAEKYNPDWFVFIFWHRFGSDAGMGMRGTEEEWDLARQMSEKGNGHPKISIYFNQGDPPQYELDDYQQAALEKFQNDIFSDHQALACHFRGTTNFEEIFRAHLTQRLLELSADEQGSNIDQLKQELLATSQALLNWPRTLGKGHQIERIELGELLTQIRESERSTTMILGSPGTGKSALLATLARRLLNEEIALLAIKADMLGSDVETFDGLRDWLHLSADPRDTIRILSEKGKVVVIIDQLDAISYLLDQKSGRLNLLLNFIQYLSSIRGVHIIASSREFEFRHDVRLNSINAERMDLTLPEWDRISPILAQEGHNPDVMGEFLRELLRTPWHLKLFLDVAAPGEEFESLQSLLGKLWDKHVVDPGGPHDRLALLEKFTLRMAREETLWLPVSAADEFPKARQAFEQAEILVKGPHEQTIGFRHQTYYDYTLARVFARGSVSLADHVLQRQDGLFVRPTLLSSLGYLRMTSRHEYHVQLKKLMESNPRLHIHRLLLEFMGDQKKPDDVEAMILLPLLSSETEGPRVLSVVTENPGWFDRLYYKSVLREWMKKSPEKASFCVPFLKAAAAFSRDEVLKLLQECWTENQAYDSLSLEVLLNLQKWDLEALNIASMLIRRSAWYGVPLLADQIAEHAPELAPRVLRAELDRRLEEALTKIEMAAPEPPPGLSDASVATLRQLIDNERDWYNVKDLAAVASKSFLFEVWPWFLSIVKKISHEEHKITVGYRDDPVCYRSFEGELPPSFIIPALLASVCRLAESDPEGFLVFVQENVDSNLLIVHRFIARGLEKVAHEKSDQVLKYLVGDTRRLVLGDYEDCYLETKRLIFSVIPFLFEGDRLRLEEQVLKFNSYKEEAFSKASPQERFDRLRCARRDRLRLLRAFPKQHLSQQTKRILTEEERALPNTKNYDSRIFGGTVGPRISVEEMARSSDEDLLQLISELPDNTGWDNPRRKFSGQYALSGGAGQLSQEFQKLAKENPERIAELVRKLEPHQHETYAGAALEGLAESASSTANIVGLFEELNNKGFDTSEFQERAATSFEKLAHRDNGLPSTILSLLEDWLPNNPYPAWPSSEDTEDKPEDNDGPILFGPGGIFFLPHGRGSILRAIAAGYLRKEPPAIDQWARVLQSRLGQEKHPKVWTMTLQHMPILFRGDRSLATRLYDEIIRSCPAVLHDNIALYPIARVMGWVEPRERAHDWLERLMTDGSVFCLQAYGELLVLYHYYCQDDWSGDRIRHALACPGDRAIHRGLAYAASYLWSDRNCRSVATEILCTLAMQQDESIQRAIAGIFRLNRNNFDLNTDMRKIIQAVGGNQSLLLMAASDLVQALEPLVSVEPDLVSQVCHNIVRIGKPELSHPATFLASHTDTLTNIALTLHRLSAYREVGLRLFEELLSLNLQEARAALEILDRKPIRSITLNPRRRRRRRSS